MEIDTLTQFVSTVGFPIAMCVALFYYMVKQNDKHDKEISELTNTINQNTNVLTELTTLIKTLTK